MTKTYGEFTYNIFWRKGDVGIKVNSDSQSEIVIYERDDDNDECCYTIAFFERTKEGFDMRTIGTRFIGALDEYHISYDEFINAVKYIHEAMNSLHNLEKEI